MIASGKHVLDLSVNTMSNIWSYTYSSTEYAGLLTYSYIKAGGQIVTHSVSAATLPLWKITEKSAKAIAKPIAKATTASAKAVADGCKTLAKPMAKAGAVTVKSTVKAYKWSADEITSGYSKTVDICTTKRTKQLNRIEDMLKRIDERIEELERKGIVLRDAQSASDKTLKKQLTDEKKTFLKGILQENIMLIEEGGS
ncbi:magnetosome protein Mad11 [Candidatus Magnetoovum chiemensis]|nr:magnetosome protein Mad11 [Candidatus Magnetoovum chiemensis]